MFERSRPQDAATDPDEIVRLGIVASVDLQRARLTARIGEIETGPIRWSMGRCGATRIWVPPAVGEQVLIVCPGGDIEAAVAIGAITRDAFPPGGDADAQLMVFADGAVISYDPTAHRLEAALPAGGAIDLNASGGVTLSAAEGGFRLIGDVELDGKLTATGDILAKTHVSLADHVHGLVRAGTEKSGKPT